MQLLVGTLKGGFILDSDSSRRNWKLRGPFFDGYETYDMAADTSGGKPALYAGVNTWTWGPVIYGSTDGGKSWKRTKAAPRYKAKKKKGKKDALAVKRTWNIQPDGRGRVYAGVEPAGLFFTDDGGTSWQEFESLNYHPTRDKWQPGNGGLCLHTIVIHPKNPKKIRVGISAVGVIGSDNGGKAWTPANKGLPEHAYFNVLREAVAVDGEEPGGIYCGTSTGQIYYSADEGESWHQMVDYLPRISSLSIVAS